MEQEVFFHCPYCAESISMVVDLSVGSQEYIEDCEVCCRPIKLNYQVDGDGELNGVFPDRSNG